MGSLHLCVGGAVLDMGSSAPEAMSLLRASWDEFLQTEAPAPVDAILDARPAASIPEPRSETEVTVVGDGRRTRMARGDFEVILDRDASRATLRYTEGLPSLSAAIRVFVAVLLRDLQGALVHASSVRVGAGDEALIFPGISGTGKTTVAALGAPRGVLSDEITGLRVRGDDVFVHPTPFWGDMPRVRAAPSAKLRAVVLLKRGGAPRLDTAPAYEGLAALLEGALLFGDASADDKRALYDNLRGVVSRVPCHRLRYDSPSNPWHLLDPEHGAPERITPRDSGFSHPKDANT